MTNTNIAINNFKIEKLLGYGVYGTSYIVTNKNKKYALKIEKISEKNLNYNLSTNDWRDIEFSQNFANNYPDQFIYLYKYDLLKNCSHIQKYPKDKFPDYLPKEDVKKFKRKNK